KDGRTYLLEVDPYAWMRHTRLFLLNGYPGDKKINNAVYDSFMLAPLGAKVTTPRFLFYSSAFLYRAASFFLPDLSLETFLFYLPLFHLLIFFIATYCFCRQLFSPLSALWTVFFLGLAPIFLQRSTAGWFDSDILNLFFPLMCIWSLSFGINAGKLFEKLFFCLMASLFLALFSWTWVGWWFIFLIVNIFFLYMLVNETLINFKEKDKMSKSLYGIAVSYIIFTLGSILFCKLLAGIEPFSATYNNIAANINFGRSIQNSIWPNVYYTVRELQPGNLLSIIKSFGQVYAFIAASLSAFLIFMKEKRSKNASAVILLNFWMFFMFLITLKAKRFSLFLVIPFSIFLGAGLDMFFKFIFLKIHQAREKAFKVMLATCVLGLIFVIIYPSYHYSKDFVLGSYPLLNDQWYSFLNQIKEDTSQVAVINAWWDYGNWVKEIADRKVLFDPQSQDRPLAYWLASALLTEDEFYAQRIFRMLNNYSDRLFDEINSYFKDDFRSLALLKKLLHSQEEEAKIILEDSELPGGLRHKIIDCLFVKRPAPAYLIIDESILSKISTLSFIANWDFSKAYLLQNAKEPKNNQFKRLNELFSLSRQQSESLYKEMNLSLKKKALSESLSRRFSVLRLPSEGSVEGGSVFFENSIIFDRSTSQGRSLLPGRTKYEAFSFNYLFNGEEVKFFSNRKANVSSGALFLNDGQTWQALEFLPQELGRSLVFRLYFMKAKDLKYFEPFIINEQAKMYAFRIIW
ncbi:MAG: hypothetical protein JW867_05280, partial [Candidatus Omnitrophica bacterium]|nr:hypothetical protein [Candidatus Omnitrophota bacterium]